MGGTEEPPHSSMEPYVDKVTGCNQNQITRIGLKFALIPVGTILVTGFNQIHVFVNRMNPFDDITNIFLVLFG